VTSSLTDGDGCWPTPTTAPAFSGFAFVFWSAACVGKPSIPNYHLTQQTMSYPVKMRGSAAQMWAWYTPTGDGGSPYAREVWIDSFDVGIGSLSNDPKIVTVSSDPGGALTANANSLGAVPTSSSGENILAHSKLAHGAVFDSWSYIFGPSTPSVAADNPCPGRRCPGPIWVRGRPSGPRCSVEPRTETPQSSSQRAQRSGSCWESSRRQNAVGRAPLRAGRPPAAARPSDHRGQEHSDHGDQDG